MGIFEHENFIIFMVLMVVFLLIAIFMSLPFAIAGFFLVLLLFWLMKKDPYKNANQTY